MQLGITKDGNACFLMSDEYFHGFLGCLGQLQCVSRTLGFR